MWTRREKRCESNEEPSWKISGRARRGERRGSSGETLVSSGERLTPYDVGALKYVAEECVDTYRAPRVRILSTGDELVADARLRHARPGASSTRTGRCFERFVSKNIRK